MSIPGIPDPEEETTEDEGDVHEGDDLDDELRLKVHDEDELDTDRENSLFKGVQ